jgi:hypothetical protein
LAVAAIAVGGSTLSASALQGQKSSISKGSMSRSVTSHRFGPRTFAYSPEAERRGYYDRDRYERLGRLYERERLGRYEPGRYERRGRLYERERLGRYEPGRYERFGRYERPYGYYRRGEGEYGYRYERPYGYYRHTPRYYGRK